MLHSLETTTIIFTSFDFGMSKGGVDTFALMINYLDESWIPRHASIGSLRN
jgi:hypothetical protein